MKRKYPFVKQKGLKDCASACTLMIIKYYQGSISMNKLNEMLKTTRKGTTAYHIVKTLKNLGFEAYGIKGDLNNLKNHPIPFIASCIIENSYKHFVVVYEITKNYIVVADPAKKIIKMPREEFEKIWTGISLHSYPTQQIIKMKDVSIIKFLKNLVISNFRYLLLIFCLSLLVTSLSIIVSFFFQIVIDNIQKDLLKICAIFTSLFLLKIFFDYLRNKTVILLNKKVEEKLTNQIFSKIVYLPYSYYQGKTTGEVISYINDLNSVRLFISTFASTLLVNFPLMLITMLILCSLNKFLFIIVLATLVLYLFILWFFKNKVKSLIFLETQHRTFLNSYMTEVVSGFETVKGLGIEEKILNKYKGVLQKKTGSTYQLDNLYNKIYFCKEFINIIFQVSLVMFGALLVQNNEVTTGSLMTYFILTSYFFTSVQGILNFDFEFKEIVEALRRILDLTYYDNKPLIDQKIKGHINIKNLSYSFDDVTDVLKNVNLKINTGEKILISGKSGSGKSTLLKIIKKFYPVEGKVFIDNIDISKLDKKAVDKSIVYVGQNEILFTASLLENLTFRGGDYNKAMQLSMANEIISSDLGLYMLIEENGFNLSGGQKQRLTLARTLQNFDVILIDEGFSAIDVSMERKILKNLFQEFKDKTIIVVSHRLDNLDLFERFIKMHSGTIILDERKCDKC